MYNLLFIIHIYSKKKKIKTFNVLLIWNWLPIRYKIMLCANTRDDAASRSSTCGRLCPTGPPPSTVPHMHLWSLITLFHIMHLCSAHVRHTAGNYSYYYSYPYKRTWTEHSMADGQKIGKKMSILNYFMGNYFYGPFRQMIFHSFWIDYRIFIENYWKMYIIFRAMIGDTKIVY